MRITFRKGRKYDGRMRLPETYRVMVDGKEKAIIQSTTKQFTWEHGTEIGDPECWFWYGQGMNTAQHPKTLEDCKKHVRSYLQWKFGSASK